MRPAGIPNTGLRWDPVLKEFKWSCQSCRAKGTASYWPLTLEFWQPAWGMHHCRACILEERAVRDRARYLNDPEFRAAKIEANREQRRAQARFAYKERWAKLRADPEKYAIYLERRREQERLAMQRLRARRKAA